MNVVVKCFGYAIVLLWMIVVGLLTEGDLFSFMLSLTSMMVGVLLVWAVALDVFILSKEKAA